MREVSLNIAAGPVFDNQAQLAATHAGAEYAKARAALRGKHAPRLTGN